MEMQASGVSKRLTGVSKMLTEISTNPLASLKMSPQVLFKFQYFFGTSETLKWFRENLTESSAQLHAVTEAEHIKSSDDNQLMYLVQENFLFEAVRLVKTKDPTISMADLFRKINLPKVNLPEYNHKNYEALLCSYWQVNESEMIELKWNDFPSNGEKDVNVCVPYHITINKYLLLEAKILLESLAAWYGQNFNTLPFAEFMCRLNWFIRHALHQFDLDKNGTGEETKFSTINTLTNQLAEGVSQVLNSPESALKDVLNSAAFLIDEGRDQETFELHLDHSLMDFYRKILESHVNLCPTIFAIFIVTKLFLSGNFVIEKIASDKAIATLCVWAARKIWARSSTFSQRHNIREFSKAKQILPVFIKDRFSLSRLLSQSPDDLTNRFRKMESMFKNDNIPLYILANYVPWIFINERAFPHPNVPMEYLPLAAFIHIRHTLNKVSAAANANQNNQINNKAHAHLIVESIIKVLSIRNLVEPMELLQLANILVDYHTK